jgi:hypothetical protein
MDNSVLFDYWLPSSNIENLYGLNGKLIGNTFYMLGFEDVNNPNSTSGTDQVPSRVSAFSIGADGIATPEPGTLLLAALGLIPVMGLRRRRVGSN